MIVERKKKPVLNEMHPHHFQTQQHAGPVTTKIPTSTEQLQLNEEVKAVEQADEHSNNGSNRRRTSCFCIGQSNIWSFAQLMSS